MRIPFLSLCLLLSSVSMAYDPTARPFQLTQNDMQAHHSALSPIEAHILQQVDSSKRASYQPKKGGNLLRMIVKKNGRYIAYLGKTDVRLNDKVGQMTVTQITQHSITLSDGQNTVTLALSGSIQYFSHNPAPLSLNGNSGEPQP